MEAKEDAKVPTIEETEIIKNLVIGCRIATQHQHRESVDRLKYKLEGRF